MKGEPFVYVDLCKPLAPDFIRGNMDQLSYLQLMIDAVQEGQDCVLEVVMLDGATIAHLIPIDAYGEEDEDAEEDY